MLEHYGSGKTCSIFATAGSVSDKTSTLHFLDGSATLEFPFVTLELVVEGETAIKGDFYAFVGSDLTVKSGQLTGANFNISVLLEGDDFQSSMPDLTKDDLVATINDNLPTVMDTVNAALAAGIPLPTDI